MQTDLVYWMLLAHLPRWTTFRTNQLIVDILHHQNITFEAFFSLSHGEWIETYQLNEKEVKDLEEAQRELANYSFLLEDMLSQGYELIPINSSDYPKILKENLKLKSAPPLLYIKGNKNLLHDETIAIVGSRKANDVSLEFTKNVAVGATKKYHCIVSGGAKGVDQTALEESINAHGHSILVLPQGILTFSSGMKKYYKHIVEGNLLVVSTFPPKAGWSTGLAMGRNKYIYGLSKEIYVAESDSKGGTWSGVLEGLKAERTIYVRKPNSDEKNANDLLILKGAKAVDMHGTLIHGNEIDEVPLDEKVKNAILGVALTAKEIKEKIHCDIDTRKFSAYVSNLPFVTKTKKGSAAAFIFQETTTQPGLFD